MMKTYYLAGPMTGYPQFNFPAFVAAAEDLRARGYNIISPAELDGSEIEKEALASVDGALDAEGKIAGSSWGDLLARDVKIIADKAQGIVLLNGWDKSRGARLEAFVGLLCGHEFLGYAPCGKIFELPAKYVRDLVL